MSNPLYETWKADCYDKSVEKFPERQEAFQTSSEISVPPTLEAPGLPMPGQFPFTRSIQPSQYRSRFWTMRQYAGFTSAEESNQRYRYLLDQGAQGLSVAFDLPTQIGYDSDQDEAIGEVGRVGVPISSLRDMEVLFDGIALDQVSVSMTINSTAPILLALLVAVAQKQGSDSKKIRGTIQNDILKEYMARGTYRFPIDPSMRLVTNVFSWASEHTPKFNTISISGYHIREAGCTAHQEIAFTLADGIAYVEAALKAGLALDEFAPRLSFFFNAHNNFFEEIAKFRAARRLWAEIMRGRFGSQNDRSCQLRFHTQTAGSTLTAQQPENNIARVTLQALAAVLGGTQSLHTNSLDEALALPTEKSAQIALRTQQIIAHESGVADTVDPLGGSPYVEALTTELYDKAKELIETIDSMGGMVSAIKEKWPQGEIRRSAYAAQKSVDSGQQKVVGVNDFVVDEETSTQLFQVDPTVEKKRRNDLARVRKNRDNSQVERCLKELKKAASGNENLMPFILEGVKEYTTLGEICSSLQEVFGEFQG